MELNGQDLRSLPLAARKAKLRDLINEADDHVLRLSETFPDPLKLLKVADKAGLEGIVCKLSYQPYRSGKNPGWNIPFVLVCSPGCSQNRPEHAASRSCAAILGEIAARLTHQPHRRW
jgi:hypothetical protein